MSVLSETLYCWGQTISASDPGAVNSRLRAILSLASITGILEMEGITFESEVTATN